MRPPICAICDKDFRNSENISGVHFALSKEDVQYNKRFDQEGFVGHPAGFEWFCEDHIKLAEKYSHLTLAQAMVTMREVLEKK